MPSRTRGHRILAAIMITDAVGFSARMSVDEGLTLRLIDRDLTLISQICDQYGGKVLKSTGDGLLLYFLSAVEAVSCGLEMQQQLIAMAANLRDDEYLDHRIGIHLGDIVVSESDVMGNGVNITARLQNYAKPRGLCISQTIFDVVKARLSLNAEFLGPLNLKNIQEPVPAYQVSLDPVPAVGADPVLEDTTCPLVATADSLLDTVVATLTNSSHSLRNKKLIFAACQQAWENDATVLERFPLHDLLETLRQRFPTLEELRDQLTRIVLGLNRQTIYRDVAAFVLDTVEPWYAHSLDHPESAKPESPPSTDAVEQRCQSVVQALTRVSDGLRTRKLLYCLNYNTWENDANRLNQLDLLNLVQEIYQGIATSQDLRYHLERIIKRLNRRSDYARVANQVFKAFNVLYETSGDRGAVAESRGESLDDSGSHTGVTCLAPNLNSTEDLTTLHSSLSSPAVASPPSGATTRRMGVSPKDRSTLFDLRLDILQYTNPLRAKILLYSCLHGPFSFSSQDWSALKVHSLDDLLQHTFDYCTTFADLDSKLTIIAHCLDNADENEQVAATVSRLMKTYYPQDANLPLIPSQSGQTSDQSTNTNQKDSSLQSQSSQADAPVGNRCSALSPA